MTFLSQFICGTLVDTVWTEGEAKILEWKLPDYSDYPGSTLESTTYGVPSKEEKSCSRRFNVL